MSDLLTKLRNFESFLTKNVEAQGIVGQAADQIESLQRDNAALRDVLDRRGNLSKYVDSGNLLAEQKAAAITPEMREKLNECIAGYRISGTDGNRKYWAVELISVVSDLLGEQDD